MFKDLDLKINLWNPGISKLSILDQIDQTSWRPIMSTKICLFCKIFAKVDYSKNLLWRLCMFKSRFSLFIISYWTYYAYIVFPLNFAVSRNVNIQSFTILDHIITNDNQKDTNVFQNIQSILNIFCLVMSYVICCMCHMSHLSIFIPTHCPGSDFEKVLRSTSKFFSTRWMKRMGIQIYFY